MLITSNTPEVMIPLTAAMLSQSGLVTFVAAQLVDGGTGSAGFHTDTSVPGAYLKIDLGTAKRVQVLRLYPVTACAALWDIEFSDDNATWFKAARGFVASLGAAFNSVSWDARGSHRYWRMLLMNTPGAGPYIMELELREKPPIDAKLAYGFTISDAPGWMDTPSRQTPAVQVLRRGGMRVLDRPRDQPRQIVLHGNIRGTSTQDSRDKADALKLALSYPTGVSLTFEDLLTRYVCGRLDSFRVPPYGPSFITRDLSVEASLTAHDPYSYDIDAAVVAMPAAASTGFLLPGTAPIRPVVTIVGACVNPVISLYGTFGVGGVLIGAIGLAITNGAGDVLDIDMDAKTVKQNGVNIISSIASGDFWVVEPGDLRIVASGFYIGSTSGGGYVTYRRSWR